jgi:hypothetical protein
VVRRIIPVVAVALVAAGAALGLAGCGSGDDAGATTAQTTGNAAFCASLDDFSASLADLRNLSPSSTSLTDLQSAGTAVANSWDALATSATELGGVDTSALRSAWDDLGSTIRSLPGNGKSIQQDVTAVKAALTPVDAAVKGLAPDCSGTVTTR